jgi:hypothetical protein
MATVIHVDKAFLELGVVTEIHGTKIGIGLIPIPSSATTVPALLGDCYS